MRDSLGARGLHPAPALLFFVFALIASTVSTHPLPLGAAFFSAVAADLTLQQKKAARLLFRALLPMIALITAFNGFYNHYGVTVLFTLGGGNRFTLEALVYGFIFAVRAASAVLWLDCLGEVLTADKVIWLFSRFSPRLALVISMVLRFLPLIRGQSEKIRAAELAFGCEEGSLPQKLRLAAHRLSILISWTLERGVDTADSMRARGYGLKGRKFYSRFSFSPVDTAVTAVTAAALALYLIAASDMQALYNPVISVDAPGPLGVAAFLLLCACLLSPVWLRLRFRRLPAPGLAERRAEP